MIRRILGLVMILIGLTGVAVSVAGAQLGHQVVATVGEGLVDSLNLLSQSLDNAQDSLVLAKASVVDVSNGLSTLEATTATLSQTLDESQPLLSEISKIASEDVPDSLDTVQETLPSVIQVAGVVDDTLTTLNNFRIDERILGITIQYDLGIDYNPAVPFDDAIAQIGRSLEGIPQNLRGLEVQVEVASGNLDTLSQDLGNITSDLTNLNNRIREVDPLLDEYLRIVVSVNDAARQVRNQVAGQIDKAKQVITLLTIWLGLTQIAPLYLGWELFSGRRLR